MLWWAEAVTALRRLQTCFECTLSEASSAAQYLKLLLGRQYAKFVFHVCAFLTACICLPCMCAPCLCVRDYCEWVQAGRQADSRAPLGDGLIRQGSASKRLTAARASASLPLTWLLSHRHRLRAARRKTRKKEDEEKKMHWGGSGRDEGRTALCCFMH